MSPETTKNYIHLPIQPKAKFKATSIKWITISEDEGIYAYSAIPKGKKGADSQIITYVFDKKSWTMTKAKKWIKDHEATVVESEVGYIPEEPVAESEIDINIDIGAPKPLEDVAKGIVRAVVSGELTDDGTRKGRRKFKNIVEGIIDKALGAPEKSQVDLFEEPPADPETVRLWQTLVGISESNARNDYHELLKDKASYGIHHNLRIFWNDALVSLLVESPTIQEIHGAKCSVEELDPEQNDPKFQALRAFEFNGNRARSLEIEEGKASAIEGETDRIRIKFDNNKFLSGIYILDETDDGELILKIEK